MSTLSIALSAITLLPAMVGVPPGEDTARSITVALCAGGNLTIPIDGDKPATGIVPCCAKGCHSRRKRELDPEQ